MKILFIDMKTEWLTILISYYIFTKVYPKRNVNINQKNYCLYAFCCTVFSVFTSIATLCRTNLITPPNEVRFVIFWMGMVTYILASYSWFHYVVIYLRRGQKLSKWNDILSYVPMILYILLCGTSYWTHLIYYMDSSGQYCRGSWWILHTFFCSFYILSSIAHTVWIFLKGEQEYAYSRGIVLNSLFVIAGAILQICFEDNYMEVGMILGLLVTYIEICAHEQHQIETLKMEEELLDTRLRHVEEIDQGMRVTAAINADYASIYYVDLNENTFVLYKTTKQLRETVHDVVRGQSDFARTIEKYIESFVIAEDKERLYKLLNREALKIRLLKEDSFFIRYRVNENPQNQEWFEAHVVNCGTKVEDYQIALGFRCIDSVLAVEQERRRKLEEALDKVQEQKLLIEETFEKYRQADVDRRTDFLTGLHNRHDMFKMLHDSVTGECDPIKNMFMMDIDNFKRLNDRYGHSYGDDCLKKLGYALTLYGRANDIVFFRYGGEEILGIGFNETKEPGVIAEELLQLVRDQNIVRDDTPIGKVTVSIGYTMKNNRYEKMIDYADKAMYRAKENGKNQAVCFDTMK